MIVTAVRMGRLGDLVMTLPALRWLAEHTTLQVLTAPLYVGWLQDALPARVTANASELEAADAVLDLHGVAASRRALRTVPRRPGAQLIRTPKESVRRRLLLTPLPVAPRWTWPERHLLAVAELASRCGLPAPPSTGTPRLVSDVEPLPGRLGVVPGAAWATKRWPHAGALAAQWGARTGGEAIIFASAEEDALAEAVIRTSGGAARRWPEDTEDDPLRGLIRGLASCAVVVAGDTGPLHLAGALRRPLVGLYGPTPRTAGFAVWPQATLLGGADCSPCSLHGSDRCPRSHHRCLADLDVAGVLAACLEQTERRAA